MFMRFGSWVLALTLLALPLSAGAHAGGDEAREAEVDRIRQLNVGWVSAVAEKDLAWTLQLARQAGVKLPGTALVSQLMAQVYGLEDEKRR